MSLTGCTRVGGSGRRRVGRGAPENELLPRRCWFHECRRLATQLCLLCQRWDVSVVGQVVLGPWHVWGVLTDTPPLAMQRRSCKKWIARMVLILLLWRRCCKKHAVSSSQPGPPWLERLASLSSQCFHERTPQEAWELLALQRRLNVLVRGRSSLRGALAYEAVHRGLVGRSGNAELSAKRCTEQSCGVDQKTHILYRAHGNSDSTCCESS